MYHVKKEFANLFENANERYHQIRNAKTKEQTTENGQSMAAAVKGGMGGGETEMKALNTKKKGSKQLDIPILSPGDP